MVTSARAAGIAASGLQGVSVNSAPSMASPAQVSTAVGSKLGTSSGPAANPHDAVGYNPTTDPTSSAYNPNATTNTNQPAPQATNTTTPAPVTAGTAATQTPPAQSTPSGLAGGAPLTGNTASQAGQAIDQLKQKYGKALTDITGTGVQSPTSQGAANTGIQKTLDSQPPPAPPVPAPVTSFLDPNQNPAIGQTTDTLRELLSPAADRQALTDAMSQLQSDRSSLTGLRTELMNVKNIMAGSQQDIMDEVTKAGGTISASLLSNMTIARNRALVQQSAQLTDQIQAATDLVNTDTSLVGDMKQMAATQFQENMGILQYQQTNYNNQLNAARDSIKTLLGPNMENAQAVYNSVKGTAYESRYEQVLGIPTGGLAQLATTGNTANEKTQLELQGLKLDNAKKSEDIAASTPGTAAYDKNQDKLEQQYRTVLLKEASNRSGDLGIQNNKVSQAVHLTVLLNQYKDPKTGNYNVPTAQYSELAMGLANLISPSGSAESDRQAILSKTASGDLKGAISYITGTPQNGNTQAIIKNLADSIDRQGSTAEDLRNEQVNFLQGLAPTGLDQSRIEALNKNALPSYKSYKTNGSLTGGDVTPKLLAPAEIPSGYYQASDGLLYAK